MIIGRRSGLTYDVSVYSIGSGRSRIGPPPQQTPLQSQFLQNVHSPVVWCRLPAATWMKSLLVHPAAQPPAEHTPSFNLMITRRIAYHSTRVRVLVEFSRPGPLCLDLACVEKEEGWQAFVCGDVTTLPAFVLTRDVDE